jgi:hypothetical protein
METWKWVIGVSIAVGIPIGAGVWGAVKGLISLVAQLTAEATEIKVQLRLVVPIAQEMPAVKQGLAVHEHRITDHDDDIEKLQGMAAELATLRVSRKH